MNKKKILFSTFFLFSTLINAEVKVGAAQLQEYLPLLKNKRIGLVANHTSLLNNVHLLDTLRSIGVNIIRVFAPEHGFRGNADAGEMVSSYVDKKTGVEISSIYGSQKKPTPRQLQGVDIMIFDMQDVGARFYTYLSTMHYIMEACAENIIPIIVLDRPNPNGHYVDGPILQMQYTSFVGMHPIPIVHG
ncbi:MAG: exo-beta-N-acetylmuramidase NamZ family protein, partial [Bacteroidales bacterium]